MNEADSKHSKEMEEAKEKGIIKSVREILDSIDNTNFRVSDPIKQKLLKEAKE